jgi:hypothetical protein
MAASDYVPIFFKNRLDLAGRPQMSSRPSRCRMNWFGYLLTPIELTQEK